METTTKKLDEFGRPIYTDKECIVKVLETLTKLQPFGHCTAQNEQIAIDILMRQIDLLEHPTLIPIDIQDIVYSFDEEADKYQECARIEAELKPLGYTIDYGLDGELVDLKKI